MQEHHSAVVEAGPPRRSEVLSISRRGFHRIAYTDWGDEGSARVAVCVHGLTRQGRDFDPLGRALARHGYRVVCPDLAGRGRSDWLRDPDEYALPQYAMDLTVLLARLDVKEVDWVGSTLRWITPGDRLSSERPNCSPPFWNIRRRLSESKIA